MEGQSGDVVKFYGPNQLSPIYLFEEATSTYNASRMACDTDW